MQLYLGELLEKLDKVYPKSLTVQELRQEIAIDVDGTIQEAMSRQLITYPSYKPDSPLGTGDRISLGIKGFELLNQIRIKKAIEDLNKSSDKASKVLKKAPIGAI